MNLREGTRRLALLLGVAGAIAGGFVSYLQLQTAMEQRARHDKFEQLANSDVVKEQRKTLQSPDPYASIAKPVPQHGHAKLSDVQPLPQKPWEKYAKQPDKDKWAKYAQDDPSEDVDWSRSVPTPSQVNNGGITTINWSHGYGVASIETTSGETLFPTPAPSAWLYLLVALFPLLGFFIPWGTVRAIGWVGAGFVKPS